MQEFAYNILNGKDEQDRDVQWEEQLSNGFQLYVELGDEDYAIKEKLAKIQSDGKDSDVNIVCEVLEALSIKTPPILINLSKYLKGKEFFIIGVTLEAKPNLYAVSTKLEEGNKVAISWNISDICGLISRALTENQRKSKIIIDKRTHITSLDIRQHTNEEGDKKIIVITPKIENIAA